MGKFQADQTLFVGMEGHNQQGGGIPPPPIGLGLSFLNQSNQICGEILSMILFCLASFILFTIDQKSFSGLFVPGHYSYLRAVP